MTLNKRVHARAQKLLLVVAAAVANLVAIAQDKKVDVDINTNSGGNWYSSPWVWVIGAAVFILLLVAILRGGGSKNTDA